MNEFGLATAFFQCIATAATRRRDRNALDGIGDMNQRLLEDIGAPHWLIARAASRSEQGCRSTFDLEIRP